MQTEATNTHNNQIASLENAAPLASTVFGWWRKDVPLEVSYAYWRDVHSITVARAPGIYQYRLLHLAAHRSDLFSIDGINYTISDEDPHGVAEFLFLSPEDLQTFGKSELITKYVHKDEQKLCDRNITMSSKQGNACTYIDRIGDIPNGEPAFPCFMVCLQKADKINQEQFRQYLMQKVRDWSEQKQVMRSRLSLLEPFNQSENSPCVSHEGEQVKNYQAWIELILQDEAIAKQLFDDQSAQYIKAIHTFAIVARYTMVYNGQPTVVGLRGYPAAQAIEQAGAEIQKSPELLALIYGDVVQGGNS